MNQGRFQKKKLMEFSIQLAGWVLDRGDRDALRTTHQNQHNFFQGSFSSSTQHQRDIQSKISHQNNIIETSSLKLVINTTSTRYQSNFPPSIQNHREIAQFSHRYTRRKSNQVGNVELNILDLNRRLPQTPLPPLPPPPLFPFILPHPEQG